MVCCHINYSIAIGLGAHELTPFGCYDGLIAAVQRHSCRALLSIVCLSCDGCIVRFNELAGVSGYPVVASRAAFPAPAFQPVSHLLAVPARSWARLVDADCLPGVTARAAGAGARVPLGKVSPVDDSPL